MNEGAVRCYPNLGVPIWPCIPSIGMAMLSHWTQLEAAEEEVTGLHLA